MRFLQYTLDRNLASVSDVAMAFDQILRLSDWFWDDDFWLPPNVTWSDIRPSVDRPVNYASFDDLAYPLVLAWVMLGAKLLVEKRLLRHFGVFLGLRDRRRAPPAANELLEAEFKSTRKLDHDAVLRLSKRVDLTERKVV